MKIGARIIKTGIAVTITMFICRVFNLEPAVFGAVSTVLNMQPSLRLTFKTAGDQVIVHVLGMAAGLAAGYLVGGNPLSMGMTTILIIALYLKLKLQSGILMGIVAAIFILGSAPDQFLSHALNRSAVIFIGLAVATVINVALWPPRYDRLFTEKLREFNDEVVNYFCRAVHDFAGLENQELPLARDVKEKVFRLNQEVRVIAERLINEGENYNGKYFFAGRDEWFQAAEKFMHYNEALAGKAEHIYELIPVRLERRLKSGAMPVSEEFQAILNLLEAGCTTVLRVNYKLKLLFCDNIPVEPEEITENYWEKMTEAIEQWQPRLTGSYYLHALLEVAAVASEIRWVTRECKKLINSVRCCCKG